MAQESRRLVASWLGRIGYAAALERQLAAREALRRGEGPERLFLLEHAHVYTLGRNAAPGDVLLPRAELARRGIEVHETDRGGQVTYHGPGQLVGYPVVDLAPDRRDLRRYVRDLSELLVETLAELGVAAEVGERERIGVWVGERKIAAIGIHLSRWLTTHGFALNVDPDLRLFGGIVPCGLVGIQATSVAAETGRAPALERVAASFASRFARRFGRSLELQGFEMVERSA